MSIELRYERDPTTGIRGLVCDLGPINHSNPLPPEQVGPLMLTTRDYAAELLANGPKPGPQQPDALHSVSRHGDVLMAHIDRLGRHWSWVLYPAHWWDHEGPEVYLGVRTLLHERNPLHEVPI